MGRWAKLVSILGADREGEALVAELLAHGVDCADAAQLDGRATASYTALLETAGELLCGLADADIYEALSPERLETLTPGLADWPYWAIDANLPQAGIGTLMAAKPAGVQYAALAVSPTKAPRLGPHLAGLDMLFANRAKASALLDRPVRRCRGSRRGLTGVRAGHCVRDAWRRRRLGHG